MKKTLIALMAMAGIAVGADLTLTTGIAFTKNGETTIVDGYTNPNIADIGYNSMYWGHGNIAGGSANLASLDFTITVKDLYGASAIGGDDTISLTSVDIAVTGAGWCQDEGRTITLSTGSYSYTAELEDVFSGPKGGVGNSEGHLTLTLTDWNITKDAVLSVSIKPAAGKATDNLSVAVVDVWGGNGATATISGVSQVDMTSSWGKEAPLVKLSVSTTPAVPEPATATLSLLALAGLCVRRRRK